MTIAGAEVLARPTGSGRAEIGLHRSGRVTGGKRELSSSIPMIPWSTRRTAIIHVVDPVGAEDPVMSCDLQIFV